MKVSYPVIFTEQQSGYLIEVPDLEILTEGTDFENAVEMAKDAISLTIVCMEDDLKKAVPPPSSANDIDISTGTFADTGKGFVSLVAVDTEEYRKFLLTLSDDNI